MQRKYINKEKVNRLSTLQLEVEKDKGNFDANFKYAAALDALAGDTNGAISAYMHCREIKPNDAKTHNNLGHLLLRKHYVDAAISSFRSALLFSPDYIKARSNLAMALVKNEEYDEAIRELQKVTRMQPENEIAQNNLGISLVKSGRTTEAIVAFRRAIDLNPNYAKARENLQRIFDENRKMVDTVHASHDPEIVTELIANKNSDWVDVRAQIPSIEYSDFADCDWMSYESEFRNMVEQDHESSRFFCFDSRFFCGTAIGGQRSSQNLIRS